MTSLAAFIEKAALDALIFEIETTPKPGLVDLDNTGSHSDMTVSLLRNSAVSIAPFIGKAAQAGYDMRMLSAKDAFSPLKEIGLLAEREMFLKTQGVNTHKGAVFSFSLLAGAFGRLIKSRSPAASEICFCAGEICKSHMQQSLKSAESSPVTKGDHAYRFCRLTGARGEAANGFPSIVNIALPALESALSSGMTQNDAGVYTLLRLIQAVDDTCIYSRGGEAGLLLSKELSGKALAGDFMKEAKRMDEIFIQRRLSPGGCADLLAAARFIHIITKSKREEYLCE